MTRDRRGKSNAVVAAATAAQAIVSAAPADGGDSRRWGGTHGAAFGTAGTRPIVPSSGIPIPPLGGTTVNTTATAPPPMGTIKTRVPPVDGGADAASGATTPPPPPPPPPPAGENDGTSSATAPGAPMASRITLFYKTELCRYFKQGRCKKGAACAHAHSVDELRPMPDLTKTMMCEFNRGGKCPHPGDQCRFAHAYNERRHTKDTFKYVRTYVCVCVCVCVWRERERDCVCGDVVKGVAG
eukprot:GHVU01209204.1.p1 GENE.GHVU01209204.1~~GHVU01209204.1.p1  ORF type:complete len:241 (+),score=42.04 GHVU01209204.1:295-1017(+)